MYNSKPFSEQVEDWLKSSQPKTLASLIKVFKDKSFAIVILILMIIPALPLPTGGITHVFEIITMLLCLEMIVGFKAVWLPNRWKHMKLGSVMEKKAIPLIVRRIKWFEKHSKPRWGFLFNLPSADRFLGLVILGFTLAAFLAPPFSGLDTLPSLGVVLIALAMILGDAVLLLAGLIIGSLGVVLIIGFASVAIDLTRRWL